MCRALVFVVALVLLSCSGTSDQVDTQNFAAVALDNASCASCGMVVREQPSPRGQAIHRDGTRVFFCSLADMIHYTAAPSPHGKVKHLYVEESDHQKDPLQHQFERLPWIDAKQSWFVVGVPRQGIMGKPLMSYRDEVVAKAVATQFSGAMGDFKFASREIGVGY